MKIPEGARVCCAADLFEYDEKKALNFREFFSHYKDQFPMLIVVIGGHYGETKYDCFDNLQVLRIHCYSAQPRVLADDPRMSPLYPTDYITIPEDTLIKFRIVKGPMKVGLPQRLPELLEENDRLPLLVQMACDPQYPVRVGSSRHVARDFGTLIIKGKFTEHFFVMNCLDGVELDLNTLTCMACLSEDLEATPVTGFKYGSKAEFNEFCRTLSKKVAESGEVYDRTQGNDDFSAFKFEEMRQLWDIADRATGVWLEDKDVLSEEDEYEEIPPAIPSRNPVRTPSMKETTADTQRDENSNPKPSPQTQSPKHPKSPKIHDKGKDTKGVFGFLKKKHRGEHHSIEEEEEKSPTETVHSKHVPDMIDHKKPPAVLSKPKIPPHIKTISSPTTPTSVPRDPKGDANAGYVTLTAPKYQNTQIGRATVKPMQRVNDDKNQYDEYLHLKVEEKGGEEVYETVDEIQTMQSDNESSVGRKHDKKKQNPWMNELQNKIARTEKQGSSTLKEECGENYEDMELEKGTRQGNLAPEHSIIQPNVSHSHWQRTRTETGQQATPRGQNITSNLQEEETATEVVEFSVNSLSIKEIGENLKALKLEKYVEVFEENQVDGEILSSLSVEDLQAELGLKKLEAVRLNKFATTGHVPR